MANTNGGTAPNSTAMMASYLGGSTITAIGDIAKARYERPPDLSELGRRMSASPSMNTLLALNSPQTVVQPREGLSTGTKIAIGVGVTAAFVVGVGAGIAIKTVVDERREEALRRQRLLAAAGIQQDAYSDARNAHLDFTSQRPGI
ncbi:hypothetical protein V8F06_007115 [Rhypophila decipiens]